MESFYFIIIIALVLLAISDLVVGVSNDAVNFLNSSFGSKVANKKMILTVAAIGILAGALSSSGMMEIARKGIFNPSMFTFADIMTIFLAVMITDILLLDLFNTYGLPTSTTVSIMFELLGAAFLVACLKIIRTKGHFSELSEYLNGSNAILIISGIFLSVILAFTVGFFVQFLSRMIFSFNLKKSFKKYGPFFAGIAITIITYFLLIKGLKGSPLISSGFSQLISENTTLTLGLLFLFWSGISFLLMYAFKVNVLKLVVLFGTFSLAMAFAGNDLVNFIGVPIAGIQAYTIYTNSSIGPDELRMDVLGENIQTNSWILLAAGLIMILALRFSKKAQSVTETELNLARQSEGKERFKPNYLARLTVQGGMRISSVSRMLVSTKLQDQIQGQFKQISSPHENEEEKPAFDLIRAAVNLMTASVLIALATSFKLPLSTTYVSFMVAMGTSLADRAWTRDAAIYRVAGVLRVISGWLFTALIAFSGAAFLALLIHYGGMVAISGLFILTVFLMVRSHIFHKKREEKYVHPVMITKDRAEIQVEEMVDEAKYRISITLFKLSCVIKDLLRGLRKEDLKIIKKAKDDVLVCANSYEQLLKTFHLYLMKVNDFSGDQVQFYLHAIDKLQDLCEKTSTVGQEIYEHVYRLHQPFENELIGSLDDLTLKITDFLMGFSDQVLIEDPINWNDLNGRSQALLRKINSAEELYLENFNQQKSNYKNNVLYVSILLQYREILFITDHLHHLMHKVYASTTVDKVVPAKKVKQ